MATKVHMEALSPTMEEGQLVRWLKAEGDEISEGDVLAEIETDKATMELVARGSGVLQGVKLKEGQTAPVGEVIAMIGGEGEAEADAGDADADGETDEADVAGADDETADDDESDADEADAEAKPLEAKPDAETKPSAKARGKDAKPEKKADADASARDSDDSGGRVKASPLARRLAEEAGLELGSVSGTGPGGRITKRDIEAAVESGAVSADRGADDQAERPAAAGGARVEASADSVDVPVTQMRKSIAKRLAQSIGPIPTFYLTIECDMTRMMELRGRVNASLESEGIKTSINDFIIKSVAMALARHPEVNASWGDSVIVRHNRVHIGVAVAIEDGLITPIVRDADRKRVRDIAVEVKELAGRAREKKLKPDEYTGATFSISNLGMFGIVEFTAIINPPEAGIIAVGGIEEKPVVEGGEVKIKPRMRMTMSCDHRVIDGALGAQFLKTLREMIEDPISMIA